MASDCYAEGSSLIKKKSTVRNFLLFFFCVLWLFASLAITSSLTSLLSFPLINMTNVCINIAVCRHLGLKGILKSWNQFPHKSLFTKTYQESYTFLISMIISKILWYKNIFQYTNNFLLKITKHNKPAYFSINKQIYIYIYIYSF